MLTASINHIKSIAVSASVLSAFTKKNVFSINQTGKNSKSWFTYKLESVCK